MSATGYVKDMGLPIPLGPVGHSPRLEQAPSARDPFRFPTSSRATWNYEAERNEDRVCCRVMNVTWRVERQKRREASS